MKIKGGRLKWAPGPAAPTWRAATSSSRTTGCIPLARVWTTQEQVQEVLIFNFFLNFFI
jgi:hypothetical protein